MNKQQTYDYNYVIRFLKTIKYTLLNGQDKTVAIFNVKVTVVFFRRLFRWAKSYWSSLGPSDFTPMCKRTLALSFLCALPALVAVIVVVDVEGNAV